MPTAELNLELAFHPPFNKRNILERAQRLGEMNRSLVKPTVSSVQAARFRVRPTLWNRGCSRLTLSHPTKSYSSSGFLEREKSSRQETAEKASEQIKDTSAQSKIAIAGHKGASFTRKIIAQGTRHDNTNAVTPNDTKLVDDTEIDAWIVKTLRNDPSDPAESTFNVTQNINLHTITSNVKAGSIAVNVAFQHHAAANALNSQLLTDLTHVFDKIASIESIQAVCLTSGNGSIPDRNFCAGANVRDLSSLQGPESAEIFIRKISELCTAIRNTPVPVVALISGCCIGAGLEVAASCDIRVATRDATFSMPEVHLKIPSVVQARLLCDIIGWGRARHLMLTGYTWTAQEAYEAGLVTKLFDDKTHMMHWAVTYMKQINCGTGVYRSQKKLMLGWENQSIDAGIEAGARCFADSFAHVNGVRQIQTAIQKTIKNRKSKKGLKQSSAGPQSENRTSVAKDQAVEEVRAENGQRTPDGQPSHT